MSLTDKMQDVVSREKTYREEMYKKLNTLEMDLISILSAENWNEIRTKQMVTNAIWNHVFSWCEIEIGQKRLMNRSVFGTILNEYAENLIGLYIRAFLASRSKDFSLKLNEKQSFGGRNLEPDITVCHNGDPFAIVEFKGQFGWRRDRPGHDIIEKIPYYAKSVKPDKISTVVLTTQNWLSKRNYENDLRTFRRNFENTRTNLFILFRVHPRSVVYGKKKRPEDFMIDPIEPLFENLMDL